MTTNNRPTGPLWTAAVILFLSAVVWFMTGCYLGYTSPRLQWDTWGSVVWDAITFFIIVLAYICAKGAKN
jgi:hypothetical protein